MVQAIGMKTGPAIVDLMPSKSFNKEFWMNDIQEKGFMSPFDPVSAEIKACPLEEFLIVTDVAGTYGEMFLIYYSGESINNRLQAIEAEANAKEAERLRLEQEEAERVAAEIARKNAVYVDVPMTSKPYLSETQDATEGEIKVTSVQQERPLISLTVARPTKSCFNTLNLGSRDHDVTGVVEFRYHKVPEFDKKWARMERDIGIQAGAETMDDSSQTVWNRPVTKCTQYTPMATSTTTSSTQSSEADESAAISAFLKSQLTSLETALQQNETVDIFANALTILDGDDGPVGSKLENQLRELRNFTDLEYSKNKSLTCIDWHPSKKGVLAVSVCKTLSFDDRVVVSGCVDLSYIILWEFAEWIKPQLILQTPHECFTFKFNPTQPNIVCAGSFSGQPVMWDLTESMEAIEKRKRARKNNDAQTADEDEDSVSAIVHPVSLGHIDTSHKRMVADLTWLEPDCQINSRGNLLAPEHLDGKSYQFMTIAGDGQALIWDIRYDEITKGNLPHVAKPKMSAAMTAQLEKAAKDGQTVTVPWMPLFRMNVKRLEGVGELSLCKLLTGLTKNANGNVTTEGTLVSDGQALKSKFICSSEEGDLVFADWRPKANSSNSKADDADAEDGSDVPEYVQWMASDHNRPCTALVRSPFFGDMLLSVGDWNFHIWKLEDFSANSSTPAGEAAKEKMPIFTSPDANTYLTGGQWSPTRPGVLLISKADGCVDVWDFTDSSSRPSATLMTTPSRITSMSFLTGPMADKNKGQQQLAIGDVVGSLHVFDVPRNLWKPVTNEKSIMSNFILREIKRMGFSDERSKVRDLEYEKKSKEDKSESDSAGRGSAPPLGAGGMGAPSFGGGAADDYLEDENEAEIMAAEELAYKELEAKFIEQLGLGGGGGDEE
jgi:WD40 repeat protein